MLEAINSDEKINWTKLGMKINRPGASVKNRCFGLTRCSKKLAYALVSESAEASKLAKAEKFRFGLTLQLTLHNF